MKAKVLAGEHIELLREVLQKRAPSLAAEFVKKANEGELTRQERQRLCELVGIEFAETGMGPDSEPSLRGERIERLLDVINRSNLSSKE